MGPGFATWALDQLGVQVNEFWAWLILVVAATFIVATIVGSIMTILRTGRRKGEATNAVQQHQTAGRDAYLAGHDLVINRPSEPRTVDGTVVSSLVLTDTNVDALCQYFRDFTAVQADRLIEPYKGKWLRYSGEIRNIRELSPNELFVSLNGSPECFMVFTEPISKEQIGLKNKGDQIAAIGKIHRVDASDIVLTDCQLLISDQ